LNLFTWNNFDPADSNAARRALLGAACVTLLLTNLTFIDDEISILGFAIAINKDEMVAAGRIFSTIFLGMFILKELPNLIAGIYHWRKDTLEIQFQSQNKDLADFHGVSDEPDYANDFEELLNSQKWQMTKLDAFFEQMLIGVNLFIRAILEYSFPILLGLLASIKPYAMSDLIEHISIKTEQVTGFTTQPVED
jgi:hypothetical protein